MHGWESYPGAAAQLELIGSGKLDDLPNDSSVVLIHSLNPFGWAYGSQRSENAVDLNRNFVAFDDLLPEPNPAVDAMAEAVAIDDMSLQALAAATDRLMEISQGPNAKAIGQALMAGQYQNPNSPKYGGAEPRWANKEFRRIAGDVLSQAQTVLFLDWHTGLGPFGGCFPVPCAAKDTTAWKQTVQIWGTEINDTADGDLTSGQFGNDLHGEDLNGLLASAVQAAAPAHAIIAGGVIEFGTAPFDAIVQATILDHWMWNRVNDHSPETAFWRTMLRTLFAPRQTGWEEGVAAIARRSYDATLGELRRLSSEGSGHSNLSSAG